jgi:hypothetical protein
MPGTHADTAERRGVMNPQPPVLQFPIRHRGDPDPRRYALASIGFQWRQGAWRRGRVVLRDETIDTLAEKAWQQKLRGWTRRRPQRR